MPAALPPGYETWRLGAACAVVRRDVAPAVRAALEQRGSLYAWAETQPGREVFAGRGAAYGVTLAGVAAVVRHARRGGLLGPVLGDRYWGTPRFYAELSWARRLAEAGIPTPTFLAAAWYRSGAMHRADVATARVGGIDLASLFFGTAPPVAGDRAAALRAVGRLVRRLHDAGFVHLDLQLRNVVLARGDSTGPRAWLLDVDTCRAVPPGDVAARRANIARFHRSWVKWNRLHGERLTPADRGTFAAGYEEPR